MMKMTHTLHNVLYVGFTFSNQGGIDTTVSYITYWIRQRTDGE